MTLTTHSLRELAESHGVAGFGVTDSSVLDEARARLHTNVKSGMAGPLHFTYADPDLATDVRQSFPWARSLVVVAYPYLARSAEPQDDRPQIGRFATRNHYLPLVEVTTVLSQFLEGHGYRAETLIDDNRLADRAAAIRAGVGWRGRSTMVLVPGQGPWTLLGTVVTDAELETTEPMTRTCGTCTDCIPACPTGAITAQGLDARRCIATWLQTAGHLPLWLRPFIGTRIYGCDDCLTSCPPGHPAMARVDIGPSGHTFQRLLAMDDHQLRDEFPWWYIPNRDPRFLKRNVVIAAGNSHNRHLAEAVAQQFAHKSSLVRGHAYWAYARLMGPSAWHELESQYRFERFPDAVAELENALLMLRKPVV